MTDEKRIEEIREFLDAKEEYSSLHKIAGGIKALNIPDAKFLLAAYDEQGERSGIIAFICASCKAIAEDDANDIEDGTILTCKKCDAETVVLLQSVDKYKTIVELQADNARLRQALK